MARGDRTSLEREKSRIRGKIFQISYCEPYISVSRFLSSISASSSGWGVAGEVYFVGLRGPHGILSFGVFEEVQGWRGCRERYFLCPVGHHGILSLVGYS